MRPVSETGWNYRTPGLITLGNPLMDQCYEVRIVSGGGCDSVFQVCYTVDVPPALNVVMPDTALCRSMTYVLPVSSDASQIELSTVDGELLYSGISDDVTIGPFQQGDSCYYLRAINPSGCDSLIRICFRLKEEQVFSADTIYFCAGDSIWLDGKWFSEEGMHVQQYASQTVCDSSVAHHLRHHNPLSIVMDVQSSCFRPGSARITVENGSGNETISWHDPSLSGWVQPELDMGSYYFDIIDEYSCSVTLSFTIDSLGLEEFIVQDTVIQAGDPVLIVPDIDPCASCTYTWSPSDWLSCTDCLTPVARPPHDITYILKVSGNDEYCSLTDTFIIRIEALNSFFIPNIFSPNHDQVNDVFRVEGDVEVTEMHIFDRWGACLFSVADSNDGWDGSYRGRPVQPGVYVYWMKVRLPDGSIVSRKGDVTVVR